MSERRITSGIVYRSGKGNPGNMTPRPKDTKGAQHGLSAHVDPKQAVPPREEGAEPKTFRVAMINVSDFQELQAYEDDTGHVSIRPAEQSALEEWAESRHGEGDPHPLTKEMQDAIMGYMDVEQ